MAWPSPLDSWIAVAYPLVVLQRPRFVVLASALALGGCAASAPPPPPPPLAQLADGTAEMAALLHDRAIHVDPAKTFYLANDRRADLFAAQLKQPMPTAKRLSLEFSYAAELVNAGRLEEAVKAAERLENETRALAPEVWKAQGAKVRQVKAVAYLRLAEEQNCHLAHGREACLLPIRGGGIHRKREGSTRAAAVLLEILREKPDDLSARWLLNIAHMTLGSYPDGVPEPYRIDPAVFE